MNPWLALILGFAAGFIICWGCYQVLLAWLVETVRRYWPGVLE